MYYSRFYAGSLATLMFLLLITTAGAEVPSEFQYQGRLTDNSGNPVADGDYQITFTVYDASSGGTSLWSSGSRTVSTSSGLFSITLGQGVALPTDLFDGSGRWLGIKVGTDPELSPRTLLTTVPYAFYSQRAELAGNIEGGPFLKTANDTLGGNLFLGTGGGKLAVESGHSNLFLIDNGDTTAILWGQDYGSLSLRDPNGTETALLDATNLYGGHLKLTDASSTPTIELKGGETGDLSVQLPDDAINSTEILNGSIVDEDISSSAEIDPSKVRGTAVNLSDAQAVVGTKTFGDLQISNTTRRLALSSSAFVPLSSSLSYARAFGVLENQTGDDAWYYAQVSLPDGAEVVELKATLYEASSNIDAYIYLQRLDLGTGVESTMASFATSDFASIHTFLTATISNPTINNNGYNYYLSVKMAVDADPYAGFMQLYGAEVVYTITKPLP